MKMQWTDEYEIGIGVIDAQHRRIVEYINRIDACEQSGDHTQMNDVLHCLVDYTLSHFAFEEALMEDVGYQELESHKLTHDSFRRQIERLKARYHQGDDVAVELSEMLLTWLLKHIMTDDQSYAPQVRKQLMTTPLQEQKTWVRRASERFFS